MLLKKWFYFIFVFFVSKADSVFVSPAYYFTNGDYSTGQSSTSSSYYNTLGLAKNSFVTLHFDDLNIDANTWEYNQKIYLFNFQQNYFPYFLKLNYGNIVGEFNFKPTTDFDYKSFTYKDKSKLYNAEITFYNNLFNYGINFTRIFVEGILSTDSLRKQNVNQINLKIENYFNSQIFYSVKPSYNILKDGRKEFSTSIKAQYFFNNKILFSVGGFIGKRSYYFDSDALTLFNQNETQKSQIYYQAEYFYDKIKFFAMYQTTDFGNYKINYLTAGIKLSGFF